MHLEFFIRFPQKCKGVLGGEQDIYDRTSLPVQAVMELLELLNWYTSSIKMFLHAERRPTSGICKNGYDTRHVRNVIFRKLGNIGKVKGNTAIPYICGTSKNIKITVKRHV